MVVFFCLSSRSSNYQKESEREKFYEISRSLIPHVEIERVTTLIRNALDLENERENNENKGEEEIYAQMYTK